jgi:Mg-chelatase subunit ChlD
MKTPLLVVTLLALTATLVLALPQPEPRRHDPVRIAIDANAPRPRIEAVFVLDTTGSMGGMIQAAKDNIWSIASTMAQAQPTPELSIGIVAFRDRGDEYVTRIIPLSTDLDSVYARLMDLQASGGGDHPEAVNQALFEAVHTIAWSQDPGAYRTVFLVGDAPPKIYPDEMQQPEILKAAAARGIVVNTIQAGTHADTRASWEQIAALGQGEYFRVEQSGSAVAVHTPYDEQIAQLSRELDATRLFFGDSKRQHEMAEKQAATEKLHLVASPSAQAKRAAYNRSETGRSNALGDSELVDAVGSGRIALAEIPVEHLPAPMAAMPIEQRERVLQETAARRNELTAEIDALSRQRQEHISASLDGDASKEDSLDYRLFTTVKAQAAAKGLRYDDAAPVH